jgi:hypothetical protein
MTPTVPALIDTHETDRLVARADASLGALTAMIVLGWGLVALAFLLGLGFVLALPLW